MQHTPLHSRYIALHWFYNVLWATTHVTLKRRILTSFVFFYYQLALLHIITVLFNRVCPMIFKNPSWAAIFRSIILIHWFEWADMHPTPIMKSVVDSTKNIVQSELPYMIFKVQYKFKNWTSKRFSLESDPYHISLSDVHFFNAAVVHCWKWALADPV